MRPTQRYNDGGIEVWHGDARAVAAAQEAGSFACAILDGAYGCGKSKVWDDVKIPDLPAWYAPHLDDVDRLCAPSASLYLWNTAEGWATLHPGILARGWRYASLVVWYKPDGAAIKSAHEAGARSWPEQMEACCLYQREAWAVSGGAGSTIAHAANADPRNPGAAFLAEEREAAGMTRRDLAAWFPSASGGLTGCVSNWEGGQNFPTWAVWQRCAEAMQQHGATRERPYLVLPTIWEQGDRLRADHLRASYDHLRAEYEASRPAFTCPVGVSNVWTHGQVSGVERLKGADGQSLHPCQKPLAFAERMIRASTRPGEAVWAPFGGTCREAIAGQRIARADPEQARRVVTAEIDLDGRDYLGAVCRVLRGEGVRPPDPRQPGLFG